MSNTSTLPAEVVGFLKAGAAARYKARGLHPDTADYIFQRYIDKQARAEIRDNGREHRVGQLAQDLSAVIKTASAYQYRHDSKIHKMASELTKVIRQA